MMTDEQIEKLVKAIVIEADYDLGKQLDPRTAEEPDEVEATLRNLVAVARRHLPARKGERKRRARRSGDT